MTGKARRAKQRRNANAPRISNQSVQCESATAAGVVKQERAVTEEEGSTLRNPQEFYASVAKRPDIREILLRLAE